MKEKNLTCINCPLGCSITVKFKQEEIADITGNTCKQGEKYARKEVTNPTRIVTSTVKVKHGDISMVAVKTASDIPKEKIFDCMEAIKNIVIEAPVKIGDIVLKNVCDTNINIIATKNIERV